MLNVEQACMCFLTSWEEWLQCCKSMGHQHQPYSLDWVFAGALVQEQAAHILSALDVCTGVLDGELSLHTCAGEC